VLAEVAQNPKLRESLAQGSGYSRLQEKSLEEEIEEKKRFVPPHLQVNLEQLDCVYMTTSMMLEVPNIAENKFTVGQEVISRNFRKLVEQYDAKGVQFASQSNRDFIYRASQQLHKSQWQQALASILQVKFFNSLEGAGFKDALARKLKQVSLRIYLLESQTQYESYSLASLESEFQLGKAELAKQVARLIVNGSLPASIDTAANCVVVHSQRSTDKQEVEHLQHEHLEKISHMVDANERVMDLLMNQNAYIQYKESKK